MRAIGTDTGQLLNILVRNLDSSIIRELGTTFGYSGIWRTEGTRATRGKLITMELHGYKSAHLREMAKKVGLAEWIDFRGSDTVSMIGELTENVDVSDFLEKGWPRSGRFLPPRMKR